LLKVAKRLPIHAEKGRRSGQLAPVRSSAATARSKVSPKNPAIAVGQRVEPLDSIRSRLDVELGISTCAMPPWLARYRFPLRFSRNVLSVSALIVFAQPGGRGLVTRDYFAFVPSHM
jgi:hypothetical protein